MPLSTQMKLMYAMREILLGDGRFALPQTGEAKPSFPAGPPPLQLPRTTPENVGIDSALLEAFYRDISGLPQANAHALLVLRHGQVASEGYWSPFRKSIWHITHSLCKSFTGTAVGIAIEEGLFTLDDSVAGFFPDKLPLLSSRRMRQVTVRHLLTMTSGISYNEISEAVDEDWLQGIFSSPLASAPGERFVYNSMNSYLLSALIHRISGQSLLDYLAERLFEPMGFGPIAWERSPQGESKGGWGMYAMVEDLAKLGLLYQQKGRWQLPDGTERQLLPAGWVEEATSLQASGEGGQNYGYHLWIDSEDGNYIMNGMFGQYVTCIPGQGITLVMTAGNPTIFTDSPAYDLMRRYFYSLPSLPDAIPENKCAAEALRRTLASLRFRQSAKAPPAHKAPGAAPPRPLHRLPVGAGRWGIARNPRPQAGPSGQNEELMPGIDAFCGITWRFARNRAGLLPIIVQMMDNRFSGGVKAVRMEREPDGLGLFWEEGGGTIWLPVGFEKPLERKIIVDGNSYPVATSCHIRQNEDNEDVLIVEVCLLEHSSFRLLKFIRRANDELLLRMDEQPQLRLALETIAQQVESTGAAKKGRDSFGERLRSNEYLHFRVMQLCAPELNGLPL